MKRAVVTRADSFINAYSKYTLPVIQSYAEKCDADFIILTSGEPFLTDDKKPHYRLLKTWDLFESYERILLIDADILIRKDTPNIFDIIDSNDIAAIYEDVGSRKDNRRRRIQDIQRSWNDVGWRSGYINAGFFLFSRKHRDILSMYKGLYWIKSGSADVHLGFNINRLKFNLCALQYKWNHMPMFSEAWNGYADRFQSNVIHYGGKGVFDCKDKVTQISTDYKRMREMGLL